MSQDFCIQLVLGSCMLPHSSYHASMLQLIRLTPTLVHSPSHAGPITFACLAKGPGAQAPLEQTVAKLLPAYLALLQQLRGMEVGLAVKLVLSSRGFRVPGTCW